jgi:predicted DNA-binding protein (MmcQ/YjbR family)
MNGQQLQGLADRYATALPEATVEHRSNPSWDTYKVSGRVFLLMTDMPGHPIVTVKADPDDALALRDQHSEITAGYHMNKKHWITLESGEGVGKELVRELVTDSYRLVVAHLPKAERPVDPHTYGTGTRAAR